MNYITFLLLFKENICGVSNLMVKVGTMCGSCNKQGQSLPFLSTFCIFKHIVIWQFAYFFKSLPEISHLPNFCSCVLLVDGAVDGEKNLEKKTREVADIGVYQFSWNFLQRGCDTTMNSLTSLVFFSRLFSPSKVSSTTNSHVLNVVTYVGNMEKKGTAFGAGNL